MKNEMRKQRVSLWSLVILGLSLYVIIALGYEVVFRPDEETRILLGYFDTIVCVVFMSDFLIRFFKTESKLHFLKWGWIDFLSSIPTIDFLRWGRLFRIIRILRAAKSLKFVAVLLYRNRAKGVLFTSLLSGFLMSVFGAIIILHLEGDAEGSNIKNAQDALWWTVVTITTVGYGDFYPVTALGRLISVILMVAGIGTFGTFTAYIASCFADTVNTEDEKRDLEILEEIKKLNERLDSIESKKP